MYVYPVRRKKENSKKYHERTVLLEGNISLVRNKISLWHTHTHRVSINYTNLPNIDLFSMIIGWMEEKNEIRFEKEKKLEHARHIIIGTKQKNRGYGTAGWDTISSVRISFLSLYIIGMNTYPKNSEQSNRSTRSRDQFPIR